MAQGFYKDVAVTGKGQLTLPPKIRKAMNLGTKGKVRISMTGTGVVTMQPLKDVMSLFGALRGPDAYDPDEKSRARKLMGKRAPGKR
jgi:bifunctional DNA-binding transcriptional regulator/antitoxin component of YhaV-PrlF toxin-antitoxin module